MSRHRTRGGTKCRVCDSRAHAYLCATHITLLRRALRDLPWWLARLNEAAVGTVRLGDTGRRGTRAHELDAYTGPGGADRLDRAIRDGRFTLTAVLAQGRCNAKASALLDGATTTLNAWVRHLADTQHIEAPHLDAAGHAHWLAEHVHAIAADEHAGDLHHAVVDLTDRIRRAVNRPEPPEYCGPCQAQLTAEQRAALAAAGQQDRTHCRVQLYAKRGARQVVCPECGAEYDVAALQEAMLAEADQYSFSVTDLADFILPKLGIDLTRRTLQRWARSGDLVPSGWEASIARYQLGHVREVAARKRGRA